MFYHRHPLTSLRFYAPDTSVFAPPLSTTAINHPSRIYPQLQAHDFTRPPRPRLSSAFNQVTINQFNASKLLETAIADTSARMLPAAAIVLFSISALTTLLARPIYTLLHLVQTIGRIPVTLRTSSSLNDLCAVIQQIEVRAEQAQYFVTEIPHLRNRGESDITNYAARYTQFFNTIWMILNDITIGMVFGSFLIENASRFADVINALLHKTLAHDIIFTLQWLDSWPAGLKLNTELSRFYSQMFIGFIQFWDNGLRHATPYSAAILYVLGTMSTFGGISLLISAIADLVAVSTIHIYACYFFTGLIYHRMLKMAGSLFNLFRGESLLAQSGKT